MLDPIIAFVVTIFQWIGRGIGWIIALLMWPFLWFGRWYAQKGWTIKLGVGAVVAVIAAMYLFFLYTTQVWTNFNPDYVDAYNHENRQRSAGEVKVSMVTVPAAPATATAQTTGTPPAQPPRQVEQRSCGTSLIATAAADLTDFNVNQNRWISSMLVYKLGLFGYSWDNTPWMDNKASFQRGIHEAIRRTTIELADNMGRLRGTSRIDANLQDARGNAQFDEYTWYLGLNPPGPKTPTPSYYRRVINSLRAFNADLEKCNAVFDARADNLIQYLDRIASALGGTSAILRERADNYNYGFFDPRADDRFWFAYGQLYAYYGLTAGAHADFEDVIRERNLDQLWNQMEGNFKSSLKTQPWIIANSSEDGLFATHLSTMDSYILRVRTNMTEIVNVLQR
ncbi:MAG: DUF2333 family protein [Mesorhizobium sp.]